MALLHGRGDALQSNGDDKFLRGKAIMEADVSMIFRLRKKIAAETCIW